MSALATRQRLRSGVDMRSTSDVEHTGGPISLPLNDIGGAHIPALFLGDHGFLAKLGSELSDDEIHQRMLVALETGTVGLAGADERLLKLARAAEKSVGRPVTLMHHTDLMLKLGDTGVPYHRCAATLGHVLRQTYEVHPADDTVLGFLERFSRRGPLGGDELAALTLDRSHLEQMQTLMEQFAPNVVTVGGDFLDVLLLSGRSDLVHDGLVELRRIVGGAVLVATMYVAALVPADTAAIAPLIDGFLVPVNSEGTAMLPDRDTAISWMEAATAPILAMHTMSSGIRSPQQALDFVYQLGVRAAVVGASRVSTIQDTIHAASEALSPDANSRASR